MILKKLFQKKFCTKCIYKSDYCTLVKQNFESKIIVNNFYKLNRFINKLTENKEKILFFDIYKKQCKLACITIQEEYDYTGRISYITIKGYTYDDIFFNTYNNISLCLPKIFVTAFQDFDKRYLKSFFIDDILCEPNKGYGSMMMSVFIKYAKQLNVEYISGFLSFVDTSDEEHNKRLRHFYKKFGFEIDDKDYIKLKLT